MEPETKPTIREKIDELEERVAKLERVPSNIQWRIEHMALHHTRDKLFYSLSHITEYAYRYRYIITLVALSLALHVMDYFS